MAQRSARETRALCSADSVLKVGAGEEAAVDGPEALDGALREEMAGLDAGAADVSDGLDIMKLWSSEVVSCGVITLTIVVVVWFVIESRVCVNWSMSTLSL